MISSMSGRVSGSCAHLLDEHDSAPGAIARFLFPKSVLHDLGPFAETCFWRRKLTQVRRHRVPRVGDIPSANSPKASQHQKLGTSTLRGVGLDKVCFVGRIPRAHVLPCAPDSITVHPPDLITVHPYSKVTQLPYTPDFR